MKKNYFFRKKLKTLRHPRGSPVGTQATESCNRWTVLKVVGAAAVLLGLTFVALLQNAEFLYSVMSAEEASEYELLEYIEELDFDDVKAMNIPKIHKVNIGDETDDVDGTSVSGDDGSSPKPATHPAPAHTVSKWKPKPLVPAKCDIFDGKWVKDTDMGKPNYKRLTTCRIEARWNCHALYGVPEDKRMDHEQYRWQPNHCDMPTWEEVRPVNAISLVTMRAGCRHRVFICVLFLCVRIALHATGMSIEPNGLRIFYLLQISKALKPDMRILVVGDSLLYNQFLSLRCLLGYYWRIFGNSQIDFYRDNFLLKCLQGQDLLRAVRAFATYT
jgi:hypothetical protein